MVLHGYTRIVYGNLLYIYNTRRWVSWAARGGIIMIASACRMPRFYPRGSCKGGPPHFSSLATPIPGRNLYGYGLVFPIGVFNGGRFRLHSFCNTVCIGQFYYLCMYIRMQVKSVVTAVLVVYKLATYHGNTTRAEIRWGTGPGQR